MNNDAALSVARLDALNPRGYLSINSAYRSDAEQQVLVDRWNAGGKYNRPPYLYEPAQVGKSPHRTGRALDTSDIDFMLTVGYDHGWRRTYDYDKPHFEYFAQYDNHREDDDMGTIDDTEANQIVIGKAIQRALKFDVRPNGYGPDWKLGPTVWERLNQIEVAARTGGDIELSEEDVQAIANAIPQDIAARVIDELKKRL